MIGIAIACPSTDVSSDRFDTSTSTFSAPKKTGGSNPVGVAPSPDGKTVYLTNYGTNDLSVYDAVTGTFGVPKKTGGTQAVGVAVSPDGKVVYVINFGSSDLSIYDAITGAFGAPKATGIARLQSVTISSDGKSVLLLSASQSELSVYNSDAGTFGAPTKTGGSDSVALALSPDDKTAYVANLGSGDLSVMQRLIDPAITTTSLPSATVGTAYQGGQLQFAGDPAPTFAVSSGQLPAGLRLDAKSGLIEGTPTTPGVVSFSITATSACASNGFVIASSAPVCSTKWSRMRSPFALISTTGIFASASSGAARSAWQNW